MGNSGCKKRIKGAGKRGLIEGQGYKGGKYRERKIQWSCKQRDDSEGRYRERIGYSSGYRELQIGGRIQCTGEVRMQQKDGGSCK